MIQNNREDREKYSNKEEKTIPSGKTFDLSLALPILII